MSAELIDELEAGELAVEFEGEEPEVVLEWAIERFAPSISISTAVLPLLPTPTMSRKLRRPSGGKPRRRRAETVGMRGSSQPRTDPSLTSRPRKRFESTVYVRLRRENSYWRGREGTGRFSISQS